MNTPDKFDMARDSLRAQVDSAEPIDPDSDRSIRAESITRLALCKGERLRAVRDSLRVLVPDEELDRFLRRSA